MFHKEKQDQNSQSNGYYDTAIMISETQVSDFFFHLRIPDFGRGFFFFKEMETLDSHHDHLPLDCIELTCRTTVFFKFS